MRSSFILIMDNRGWVAPAAVLDAWKSTVCSPQKSVTVSGCSRLRLKRKNKR
jgi:hypothetical protein